MLQSILIEREFERIRKEIELVREEHQNAEIARERSVSDLACEVRRLRAANDELRIQLAAIFRLVAAKGLATREELCKLLQSVDAENKATEGAPGGPSLLYSQQEFNQLITEALADPQAGDA
jgi:hypothetical protein